MVYHTEQSLF